MRILLLGKYPPIEGGTSNQTLATAAALARHHHIDVVTNADEVELGCRHLFTPADHRTLAALTGTGAGSVRVHQTTPLGPTSYIPWAQPYASKLFGLGMELVQAQQVDLIVGWYLEPYGLVAAQLAGATGLPLLLRHAGSDIGRLASHPDLQSAYRWALQRAEHVLTGPRARGALIELGVAPERLVFGAQGRMPDYFSKPFSPLSPGELRDVALERFEAMQLSDEVTRLLVENLERWPDGPAGPVVGIYGKVAHSKGSYDLVAALEILAAGGTPFTLLGAVGGQRELLVPFLEAVAGTGHLRHRAVLLPFLAPWLVPDFLDACDLVCFLERQFDVEVHRTRVPIEVLARGRALVLSGEASDKLLIRDRLAEGRNYIRVEDPTEVHTLARVLDRYCSDPAAAREIADQGRSLGADLIGTNDTDGPASAIEQVLAGLGT